MENNVNSNEYSERNHFKNSIKGHKQGMYFFMITSFCFCFLPSFLIFPLDPGTEISDYIYEGWQTEDGLPHQNVLSISQTGDGYIWLCTTRELVRFDGVRFTSFDKIIAKDNKTTHMTSFLVGREGNLWIGIYHGGLVRYRDGKFTTYGLEESLSCDHVYTIFEDKKGNVWVGTEGGLNVLEYGHGKFRTFTTADGLAGNHILSIFEDNQGSLWIGTFKRGLQKLTVKNNKFRTQTYTSADGLASNTVTCIYEDRAGYLWVGTDNGLNRFKDGQFTTFSTGDGLSSNYIGTIYEDRNGNLWIGTMGGGLICYRNHSFYVYTSREGPLHNYVSSIFEDRMGILWIGTIAGGLYRLKDRRVAIHFDNKELHDGIVGAIFEDSKQTIWLGISNRGLAAYKNGTLSFFTTEHGLSSNYVTSILEDQSGDLWVGTYGGGLNCFKNGTFITYTEKDGLSNDVIYSICRDRKGNLWIGTRLGGLNCFRDGKFKTFTTKQGLSHRCVICISEDSRGNLWLGTYGGGLNRYNYRDSDFTVYTTREGLSGDYISFIYEDREKVLWIGTYDKGLNRFEKGKFTPFTTKEGLYHNSVYQIIEDDKNNLWLGCPNGIFRVNKEECIDFIKGKTTSITSFVLDRSDGMIFSRCRHSFQPGVLKTGDGRLWFPTINGVAVIDPDHMKINRVIPPVIIEKVKVDDKTINLNFNGHNEISPGKKKFEFHYTALSFVDPGKVKFRYKLAGFEENWVEVMAPAERIAHYTNLGPGFYCFRVKACNNDGIWNETGASFGFYIKPFFYQTHWFYGGCALCVILLGIGIHLLRVRQIIKRERKKYEKVRLSSEYAEKYLKKLLHFMESEKPYLDPNITLHKLSKEIIIPDHYLSQVINTRLNKNFYEFINFYRIEEAKKILTHSKNHFTILEVAFEVGYNSKSAFNRSFKKHVGVTPSDFRKEYNGGRRSHAKTALSLPGHPEHS
ncbi:MAG: helix-turn-helix domain-containing protein [Candidatus Aminicenantes bacterium]|nr:helix-turn-helix domain-containing protein [Candidatus Aminicenantes bacterium]NIM83818.1 helix-turn-helix domain-containing protein [Candidatus Aminicenantes bacterium]NIN23268.1 helix-turn-helix domain-containing protein [Candidatus Aminicenantes bacterium]NIN46972.1 helix-turn-helix domain-containing protein [Candidatus Aminicenantes bacterium]NIN89894.1 helix-turn-helix domain-containing protein [Candidatus Aminicenantes bacterium]